MGCFGFFGGGAGDGAVGSRGPKSGSAAASASRGSGGGRSSSSSSRKASQDLGKAPVLAAAGQRVTGSDKHAQVDRVLSQKREMEEARQDGARSPLPGGGDEQQKGKSAGGAKAGDAIPSHRRTGSFKKVPTKKSSAEGLSEQAMGLQQDGDSPNSTGAKEPKGPAEILRSRSLRRGGSDKVGGDSAGTPPDSSGGSGSGSARGITGGKITQNLKAPPTKAPQPQFSLSKKKPKDAAAEAKLQEETSKLDDLLKSSDLRVFSYVDLKAATKNWSMDYMIGAGGFGKVYRGVAKLPPQPSEAGKPQSGASAEPVEVAIKRLEAKSLQGHKEWMVEISMLGLVNHPHLVKLLGFCAEGEKRLLVYEFLPYYSLDRYLFALDPTQPILDWDTRLKIALGSARGLAHLHEEINPPIIYRDFKTSNILLDEDFNPKLSDFGLAREGPSLDRTHVSTQVRGTAGYAAPEYMLTGHLTPKADVWSFGVVLLEMLTGRPSIDQRRPQHEMKLVPLARQRLQQPGDILEMMDPMLEGQYPPQAAAKLAEVAKWCLQSDPNNRPLMSELVEVLAYLSQPEHWDET